MNLKMNRKLLVILFISLGLFAALYGFRWYQAHRQIEQPVVYRPTQADQKEFTLTIGNGPVYADNSMEVKKGQLISFVVSSTLNGVMNFTHEDGSVVQRPILMTPANQFYLSSEKVGSYTVTFDIGAEMGNPDAGRKGSYTLGVLTVKP